MQSTNQPATLPFRFEPAVNPVIDVLLHFAESQQTTSGFVEDDGRQIMVEECSATVGVILTLQEYFERIVSGRTDSASSTVPQQMFEFGRPLRMSRAAQTESITKETIPVFTEPGISTAVKTLVP